MDLSVAMRSSMSNFLFIDSSNKYIGILTNEPSNVGILRAPKHASAQDMSEKIESTMVKGVAVTNFSGIPLSKAMSYFPESLFTENEVTSIVLFPDLGPGKSPLPTGCAVEFKPDSKGWRKYAVSDCGCGMQLLKSSLTLEDFDPAKWDELGVELRKNKGNLGDLGGGNHFVDAIVSPDDMSLSFLIHTGSRDESGLVDDYIDSPAKFDEVFESVVAWARSNRDTVREAIEKVFGKVDMVLDLPHNTYEVSPTGSIIIRKGAVKAESGTMSIIPSSMAGEIALVEATEAVQGSLQSLCHGTGRTMARGQARQESSPELLRALREKLYIPSYISDASLRTDTPESYRNLDDCLRTIEPLVQVRRRYDVIAYLGHL